MSSACFSKKSLDEQKIWSKRGLYSDLESLSESEFGRPNNNVDKMFDFFLKFRCLEKLVDTPPAMGIELHFSQFRTPEDEMCMSKSL